MMQSDLYIDRILFIRAIDVQSYLCGIPSVR